MLSTLINIPSSTSIISSVADVSNPWFEEFLPFMYIGIGIFLAFLVITFLIKFFGNGLKKLFGSHDDDDLMKRAMRIRAETERLLKK